MQKILTIMTTSPDLRARAEGWGVEDSALVQVDKHIGLTPGYSGMWSYPTVLHAMHDGWKLMGPPVAGKLGETPIWDWWLSRE